MEMKSIIDATRKFIKKYQYIFLIIVTGFLLLIIPSQKTKQTVSSVPIQPTELKTDDLECDLSVLLSKICGAGRVEVLLTFHTGEEYLFQTDENSSTGQDTINLQTDTVTITDSNHNQTGLIRKTLAPTYRGAVVICEGADNPSVQLSIVDAVANATGLSTNQISVLKMK